MKSVLMIFISVFLFSWVQGQEKLVVFDGGEVAKGQGFALPRGVSKLEVSYQRPHTNKTHLEFDGKFRQGWTGFGWNWQSWEGEGTDLSAYKNMVFFIGVAPVRISDINIQLTSKNKNGEPDGMGPKVSILPVIQKRGNYVEIVIPMEKLFGDSLDKTAIWGFNIGIYTDKPEKAGDCRIFMDQIEFTK